MRVLNYEKVLKGVTRPKIKRSYDTPVIHKKHSPSILPEVSVILLDWSCRERFDSLDWLLKQNVAKEAYELIWVELYKKVVPQVIEKADTVITCGQKGLYHKHIGYNAGLLNAHGKIIVVCDSDAVYPVDFISSILKSFYPNNSNSAQPLVLMHYELRTSSTYPDNLKDRRDLKDDKWQWWPLNPNVGACMSVRKSDAIRFGGFDEHKSYRGYLCGPYDLGWRLINAGIPERWHDTSVVLWHFAHPDPVGVNRITPTLRSICESVHPHVDLHALTAVEAFSCGRFKPLKENPEIFDLRMKERAIGTKFEEKYANMTSRYGFSKWQVFRLRILMILDAFTTVIGKNIYKFLSGFKKKIIGEQATKQSEAIPCRVRTARDNLSLEPKIVAVYNNFNIVLFGNYFYGVPQSLGPVDFFDEKQIRNPLMLKAATKSKVEKLIDAKSRFKLMSKSIGL